MRDLPRNIHGIEPALLHAELDKLNSWILVPTDTLVKHLSFWFLFLLWAFLRYKVVGHKVDEQDLTDEERRALEEVANESYKGRRKESLTRQVPTSVKDKIFKIELVDMLLYASIVPLLFLGTNWKFK